MRQTLKGLLYGTLFWFSLPFVGGCYYVGCGPRPEQAWLDKVVAHIKTLHSDDPEVQAVLNYTLARYSRIGPWDVMVAPLASPEGAAGMNCPWCPGLTIDPQVLSYGIPAGAGVLIHEACHDYSPFFHPLADPFIEKVEKEIETDWLRLAP